MRESPRIQGDGREEIQATILLHASSHEVSIARWMIVTYSMNPGMSRACSYQLLK
jgi:hypothetical protein